MLQCVAVFCILIQTGFFCIYLGLFCSVLQRVAACCSVVQCGVVLQCVAVCCSVLQCVAVCCSVLQCNARGSCMYAYRSLYDLDLFMI